MMPSSKRSRKPSHFATVTHTSRQVAFAVALAPDVKPLYASVELSSSAEKGALLASFYNPAAHAWVVRQASRGVSHEGVELTVSIIVVLDPNDQYELQVSLAKLVDDAKHNDERFELKQRSLVYESAVTRGSQPEAFVQPGPQQTVTIVCPLADLVEKVARPQERRTESHDHGFVLCGGGFVSDYPVVAAGPALPETVDEQFQRLLGYPGISHTTGRARDEVENGVDVAASPQPSLPEHACANTACTEPVVWRGWQVSAAANAGLACFAMSLRRRPVSRQSHTATVAVASSSARSKQRTDASGLVPSVDSSVIMGDDDGSHFAVDVYEEGQLNVHMSALGGRFTITLPPPHGSFSTSVASQLPLYKSAQELFYSTT